MTANEPARDVVTARPEDPPEPDGVPDLVPIEEGRHYPSEVEVAADGSGGITDLALKNAAVEHGVRDRMVTISFGSDVLDPRSYEFDLAPDNAWRIAMRLIAVVAIVEPEARR